MRGRNKNFDFKFEFSVKFRVEWFYLGLEPIQEAKKYCILIIVENIGLEQSLLIRNNSLSSLKSSILIAFEYVFI